LTFVPVGAVEVLEECADDLEALVEDHYRDTKGYPGERRRYERDIAPVVAKKGRRKARAARGWVRLDSRAAPTDDGRWPRSARAALSLLAEVHAGRLIMGGTGRNKPPFANGLLSPEPNREFRLRFKVH
jgi:hypothetical protein